ncbi:hypothetical protein RQP46_008778 [Phenoliferia psychrophenolica]
MDGALIKEQVVRPIWIGDERFEARPCVDIMDPAWDFKRGVLMVGLGDADLELQSILDAEYKQLEEDWLMLRTFIFPNGNSSVFLPVNIRRTIQNAQQIFHIDNRKASDLPPAEIIDSVQALSSRLVARTSSRARRRTTRRSSSASSTNSSSAASGVLEEHHLDCDAFEWVLGEIEAKFDQSFAAPGGVFGTPASHSIGRLSRSEGSVDREDQSIGEPATQTMLHTFYYTGVSSKNVTLGVPRLKEIINVATNLKTPTLTVYLDKEIRQDIEQAKEVQTLFSYTTLKTVTASTEIFYDPDPSATVIEDDREFVEAFFAIPDWRVQQDLHRQSLWLLWFQLDRAKKLDMELEMAFVASKLSEVFEQDLFVIWSEDNSEKLIIRCRALNEGDGDKDDGEEAEEEDIFLKQLETSMLSTIALRGVEGIERVFMLKHKWDVISETAECETPTEWVLETDNLRKVLCIDGVDTNRTMPTASSKS